jgi:LPS O-antigen subunit length determinant protein (WzzB/FepE family)
MRQLIRWTARLYPAPWRERYGEELDALVEVEVLDRPSLPRRPIFPNRPMIVTVGLLGGAVLGLLAVLVRRSTLHSQKT